MRWLSSSLIGRFFLVLLLLLLCSSVAFASDTAPKASEPPRELSALPPDGSTSPQASKPLTTLLQGPPPLPTVQLDKSKPISEQRQQALDAWTNWWETQELPWRQALMTSWQSQKNLEKKQSEDTDAALKAKDAVIAAQAEKIAILTASLDRANSDKWVFGLVGFLGGAVTSETVTVMTHK